MEQYISLLILITPGFIVRYLHKKLTSGEKEKSDFNKTIISLIYSIPILFINFIIILIFTDIETFTDFINNFKLISFAISYMMLTLGTVFFFTLAWSYIHPRYTTKVINIIRESNGLSKIAEKKTVWDMFIDNGSRNQALSIYKNGKEIAKGFKKHWSCPQNIEQEILLEFEDIIDEHSECFKKIERIYYNIDKDIMIKEYNLDEFYDKAQKCKEKSK